MYRNLAVGMTPDNTVVCLQWTPGEREMRVTVLDSLTSNVVESRQASVRPCWVLRDNPVPEDFDCAVIAVLEQHGILSELSIGVHESADYCMIHWWDAAAVPSSIKEKVGAR